MNTVWPGLPDPCAPGFIASVSGPSYHAGTCRLCGSWRAVLSLTEGTSVVFTLHTFQWGCIWHVVCYCVNISGFHTENGRAHVYVWQQDRAHHLQRHHSPTGCVCPALPPAPNSISFGRELSTFHCLRAWCFCELLVHTLCPFAFWDVHRFCIGVTAC